MFQGNPPLGGGVPETLIQKDILRMEKKLERFGYEIDKQGQFIDEDVVLYLQKNNLDEYNAGLEGHWHDYSRIYNAWDADIAIAMVGSMSRQYRVVDHMCEAPVCGIAVPRNPNIQGAPDSRNNHGSVGFYHYSTPWTCPDSWRSSWGYTTYQRVISVGGGDSITNTVTLGTEGEFHLVTETLVITTSKGLTNTQPYSTLHVDTDRVYTKGDEAYRAAKDWYDITNRPAE